MSEHHQLHIIDDSLQLSNSVQEYMDQKWHLKDAGMNYNLVAVFGSQSTGKSTLLNLLFQTRFDVMQEAMRQQTTKGLWLSVGVPNNTLVMDVEGTDGRERGENQDMERKSAVFSLAISQVLIVNMFEHDVGRYNGANYGLLKTVFDVNLQLFQAAGSPKTLLLFVIRDHAQSPLENLQKILENDLAKIWTELSKPPGLENSQIKDFFDFKFTTLPHKVFKPEEFTERVTKFREWFSDPNHPDYLFQPQYHKGIPADGFYKFVSDIWEKILTNKDLDLPTQRQLLAQFRCDEISAAAFEKVSTRTKDLLEAIEKTSVIPDLGKTMAELRKIALEEYEVSAHRYDQSVYKKVGADLKEKIHNTFYPLFSGTLRNLAKKLLKQFSEEFDAALKKENQPFRAIAKELEENALGSFSVVASEITLPETSWDSIPRYEEFKETLTTEVSNKKQEQMKKALTKFKESLQLSLIEPLLVIVGEAKPKMWEDIQKLMVQIVKISDKFIDAFEDDYACSAEEKTEQQAAIRSLILQLFQSKMQEVTSEASFYPKLRRRFELSFKFDEAHRPRIWTSVDDITLRFDEAKIKARELLHLFIQADESLDLTILSPEAKLDKLISEDRKTNLWERLEIEGNGMFQEAANSASAAMTKIPPWFIALLLILGWNEIWAIITSPLYLFVAVIVGGALFSIYSLGLSGPALQMSNTIANEALRLGKEKVGELVAQKTAPGPSSSSSMGRSEKLKTM